MCIIYKNPFYQSYDLALGDILSKAGGLDS